MGCLMAGVVPRPFEIVCADGVMLRGDAWRPVVGPALGTVIVNPATGAPASYYHRYAAFLARHGFDVVTWDYRGIGRSAPASLRGCRHRWRDWGEKDFDAVLRHVSRRRGGGPILVVGHSYGGVLPGFSEHAGLIDRMLTVGAQFGHWPDYAWRQRPALFLKWHVAMPLVARICGYFPGKALGWCEDLPAGVALDWAFSRGRLELGHPRRERDDLLRRLSAFRGTILAVTVTDDPLAPPGAVRRALSWCAGATRLEALLSPGDLYQTCVGHFGLFHSRQASDFWLDTLTFLRDGANPWPDRPFTQPRPTPARREVDIVRYY